MIVDAHIHSVEAVKEKNLFWGCFIPRPESFNEADIERLNDLSRERVFGREEIIGFAAVNPEAGEIELDRAIRELGFKGLALDTASNFSFSRDEVWRLLEQVQELDIPVFIHSEPYKSSFDVDEVNEVVISFPEINFIFAHLGIREGEDFIRIVPERNVFFETSGVGSDLLTRALETIPSERLVFGSNAEGKYPQEEIDKINSLPIAEEDKQKIFFSNMAELLEIELPEENKKKGFGTFISGFIKKFQ